MTIEHNIAMRQLAATVINLAAAEAGRDPRFWAAIRDHALKFAPLPPQPAAVRPMDDDDARRFGRKTLCFGIHRDKRYDEVPLDYLEWLADQNLALSRYLASRRVQREQEHVS